VHGWGKTLRKAAAGVLLPIALGLSPTSSSAARAADADTTSVYFGVGCFWHVQHEFVSAEKKLLGRSDAQVTAATGYAGGTRVGSNPTLPNNKEGVVCYHNLMAVADYGKLGHGEVVNLKIPASSVRGFADEYFSLFGSDRERPDKGDRGPEYRSLLGLPGGVKSPLFAQVKAAADAKGLALLEGRGDDSDTMGKKAVWVMDTDTFPFHQAELYHQFHDGFMPGEQYPESYNTLALAAYKDGRITQTGCPDVVPR